MSIAVCDAMRAIKHIAALLSMCSKVVAHDAFRLLQSEHYCVQSAIVMLFLALFRKTVSF